MTDDLTLAYDRLATAVAPPPDALAAVHARVAQRRRRARLGGTAIGTAAAAAVATGVTLLSAGAPAAAPVAAASPTTTAAAAAAPAARSGPAAPGHEHCEAVPIGSPDLPPEVRDIIDGGLVERSVELRLDGEQVTFWVLGTEGETHQVAVRRPDGEWIVADVLRCSR